MWRGIVQRSDMPIFIDCTATISPTSSLRWAERSHQGAMLDTNGRSVLRLMRWACPLGCIAVSQLTFALALLTPLYE